MLISDVRNIGVRPLLGDVISILADLSYSDGQMPFHPGSSYITDSYMKKVVKTRNYYTHYDDSLIFDIFSREKDYHG